VYNNIVIDYAKVATALGLKDIIYLPISALKGDNIVEKSTALSWYEGEPLLHVLEAIEVAHDIDLEHARFPVQYVIRPQIDKLHDYRGYAGRITSGIYKKGDAITVLPSGLTSTISAIELGGKEVDEAFAPQSVILHVEDDIDISRGDVIVHSNDLPKLENEFDALVCWMDSKPLQSGSRYLLQHNSRVVKAVVRDIEYKLDVNTLEKLPSPEKATLNDVIKVRMKTSEPVALDGYDKLPTNGGAILIDQTSYVTVGACMLQ
jgi:sulfate adenylyltransferase subunit 1